MKHAARKSRVQRTSKREKRDESPRRSSVVSVDFVRACTRNVSWRPFCHSLEGSLYARFSLRADFNLFRDGKRFEFSGSGRARCERKNTATRAKYISGRVEAARHFPFFSLLFFSFSFRSLLLLPPPPSTPPFSLRRPRSRVLFFLHRNSVFLQPVLLSLFLSFSGTSSPGWEIHSSGRFINFAVSPSKDIVQFSLTIRNLFEMVLPESHSKFTSSPPLKFNTKLNTLFHFLSKITKKRKKEWTIEDRFDKKTTEQAVK